MNALDIFEEIRFITELVIGEQVFVWNFGKRKRKFYAKSTTGLFLLVLLSVIYLFIREYFVFVYIPHFIKIVSVMWYVFLTLLTLVFIYICYEITLCDTLFMVIAGYAIQHIEYIVMYEVIARGVWKEVLNYLWFYILLSIGTCYIWYSLIAYIFAKKLRECQGVVFEERIQTILCFLLILLVLLFSSFLGQNIFINETVDYSHVKYQGAIFDFFNCMLILVVQYSVFRISTLIKEKEIIKQLLYERKKQYKLSKENIDIINHKCHDMKHQLQALKHVKEEELDKYIAEVESSIMIYDKVIKTENEVLNTILSEKSLYCEKHHINLTCIVDANQLDFMSTLDIYALLGNALDNAIESVSRHKDEDKRVISFTISANESFLCIQTNNYFEGDMHIVDGLPVSTKKNPAYHGFGIKSMKHLAEKYGGTLCTSLENRIFLLQIVIPIPPEFTRLLKEKNYHI